MGENERLMSQSNGLITFARRSRGVRAVSTAMMGPLTSGVKSVAAMTAVISVNTPAAPGGFLVAGQVIEEWGILPVFTAVALGLTGMAVAFAAIVFGHRDDDLAPQAELQVAA